MQKVKMYATGTCPYCIRAEQLLRERGVVDLEKIRTDLAPEQRALMIKVSGRRTVPQIFIDGENILAMSKQQLRQTRRRMAMIFQQFNLLMQKSVARNVRYPLEIAGVRVEPGYWLYADADGVIVSAQALAP